MALHTLTLGIMPVKKQIYRQIRKQLHYLADLGYGASWQMEAISAANLTLNLFQE